MFDFRVKSQQQASNEFLTCRVFQRRVPEFTLFFNEQQIENYVLSMWYHAPMSIMSDRPTPPSGFPRKLAYQTQYISYLGNPLGGVGVSEIIDMAMHNAHGWHTHGQTWLMCNASLQLVCLRPLFSSQLARIGPCTVGVHY